MSKGTREKTSQSKGSAASAGTPSVQRSQYSRSFSPVESGSRVPIPSELTIAVKLFEQQHPRAARAWIRAHILNDPPPEVLSEQIETLPKALQEMAAQMMKGRQSAGEEPPPSSVPSWFIWGIAAAGVLSLLAQLVFVILKLT